MDAAVAQFNRSRTAIPLVRGVTPEPSSARGSWAGLGRRVVSEQRSRGPSPMRPSADPLAPCAKDDDTNRKGTVTTVIDDVANLVPWYGSGS